MFEATERKPCMLLLECLEDWIDEDNPVCVLGSCVDRLNLAELGREVLSEAARK